MKKSYIRWGYIRWKYCMYGSKRNCWIICCSSKLIITTLQCRWVSCSDKLLKAIKFIHLKVFFFSKGYLKGKSCSKYLHHRLLTCRLFACLIFCLIWLFNLYNVVSAFLHVEKRIYGILWSYFQRTIRYYSSFGNEQTEECCQDVCSSTVHRFNSLECK